MGIKVTDTDELNIIKYSEIACKTYIKNETNWIVTYSGKKSKKDKAYQNYVSINTIIYSMCYLFIFLQISVPSYIINRPHAKCKVSLDGFPLSESNENGVQYLSCILETLRETSSIWDCLKKIKLLDTLKSTLNKVLKDDFILQQYELKRVYILENKLKEKTLPTNNLWYQFKPSLFL